MRRQPYRTILITCRNCGYSIDREDLDPDTDQCPECGTTAFNLGRREDR
jgi:predicted nucleic-acid-binding Zn-ribbon protein